MILYIDIDFKCHITNPDGIFREIQTDFFNGKCDAFVEGYRYVPPGESWTPSYGVVFTGEMIAPWKPYDELDAAQREFERQLIAEYAAELSEMRENSVSIAELQAAYQEGVNSV